MPNDKLETALEFHRANKLVYAPIMCTTCGWIPYPHNGLIAFSKCPFMGHASDPNFNCPKDGKVFMFPMDITANGGTVELVEAEMPIGEFEAIVAVEQEKAREQCEREHVNAG